MYNYDSERINYKKFVEEANSKSMSLYGISFEDMLKMDNLDDDTKKFAQYCLIKCPIDMSPSTMNRICWKIEQEFGENFSYEEVEFDYGIYKSAKDVQRTSYIEIKSLCEQYLLDLKALNGHKSNSNEERKIILEDKDRLLEAFIENVTTVCPNSESLCDILLDICYEDKLSKSIVWDICGDQIIQNMLAKYNYTLTYPEKSLDADFWCGGVKFSNKTIRIGGENVYEV